jgi:hypothetical protein
MAALSPYRATFHIGCFIAGPRILHYYTRYSGSKKGRYKATAKDLHGKTIGWAFGSTHQSASRRLIKNMRARVKR